MRKTMADLDRAYWIPYLDGIVQTRCTAADDEEGWIRRYVVDEQNRLVLDDYGNAVEEVVHGMVHFVKAV